jgi:glutaredoxin 3
LKTFYRRWRRKFPIISSCANESSFTITRREDGEVLCWRPAFGRRGDLRLGKRLADFAHLRFFKEPRVCKAHSVRARAVDAEKRVGFIPMVASDITLYSRQWCSWCMDAKEYLTERGYEFTEIDVGRDREAYDDMRELSDQIYVPTLVAGDEVLANFDTEQLEKFLNQHGIEP